MADLHEQDQTVSESVLDRIDGICESFEQRLRKGESPCIETFLQQIGSEDRSALRQELLKLKAAYKGDLRKGLTKPDQVDAVTGRHTILVGSHLPIADHPDDDLRGLLRRRLKILAVVAAVGFTLELLRVGGDAGFQTTEFRGRAFFWYCVSLLVLISLMIVMSVKLFRRRELSLKQLRRVETVVMSAGALWTAAATFGVFRRYLPEFATASQDSGVLIAFLAQAMAITWVVGVFAYGVLIPNTWRRFAQATVVLCCIPLVVAAAAGATHPDVSSRALVHFLSTIGIWLTLAAVLALAGGYRVERLKRQITAGQRLGQYQLDRLLGSGGMGEVYLGRHSLLRRPCAIKVIRPERSGDGDTLRRFEREVQATASLSSPFTVQIYDFGRTRDRQFYYVMEYLEGIDLQRYVTKHGPLAVPRVLRLIDQVANALQEAHEKGLIHRDIKPSNVMLCRAGGADETAKLLDFGLVRPIAAAESDLMTKSTHLAGTPAYLSPEQIKNDGPLNAQSDIYSLGLVAFFLLTGRLPFEMGSAMQLIAAHLYEVPPPPSDFCTNIPVDVDGIVCRCLAKLPNERYQDVRALRAALRDASRF